MAGIGFELKGLFRKKGVLAKLRAVGYAGVVTTGPMLLGVLLLIGLSIICRLSDMSELNRELLNCMVTYTLLFSLTMNSLITLPVTRYVADQLFEGKDRRVFPAFVGANSILLVAGGVLFAGFLMLSRTELPSALLLMTFFGELVINWNAMSFLSAVKDFKAILYAFLCAVGISLSVGMVFYFMQAVSVNAMLFSVCCGYGVMLLMNVRILYRYFPEQEGSSLAFLQWLDRFPALSFVGLFLNVGMFGHLIVMWLGPLQVQVKDYYVGAPYYDVAAICAFITTLVTTVNYVVSVETNFYPRYRTYYSLFNNGGTIMDILNAQKTMIAVLETELLYNALKQLIATGLALALGSVILEYLPLGFNELMLGYFRTLCVGYGLYAVGNTVLLTCLYFADYTGALLGSGLFAGVTVAASVFSLRFDMVYFGFGFLVGSGVFAIYTLFRLSQFTRKLNYNVLCTQPFVVHEHRGVFTKAQHLLERSKT